MSDLIDNRHWCTTHSMVEFLMETDWGYCDWCGHVYRDLPEWRAVVREHRATGNLIDYDSDVCPYCYVRTVKRL